MGKSYPRIYRLLKNEGHSPDKAAEIVLDAKRGDKHARYWIASLHKLSRPRATNRHGDMAAVYAKENGVSYEEALVACNMD